MINNASDSSEITLDQVTVASNDVLTAAVAHRQMLDVKAASQAEYDAIVAYIQQLDGRDTAGDLPGEDPVPGVISLDNSAYVFNNNNDGATSGTISGFAVADNSNRILAVSVALKGMNNFNPANVSASFGSATMTLADSAHQGSLWTGVFYLLDAEIGSGAQTEDVTVNFGGQRKAGDNSRIGVVSLYDVKQVAPEFSDTDISASATSWNLVLSSLPADAAVIGASLGQRYTYDFVSPDPVSSDSASPAWQREQSAGSLLFDLPSSAGNWTASFTQDAPAPTGSHATVLVGFAPASSGGGGNTPPVIETQPVGTTIYANQSHTFNGAASGSPSPDIEWFKGATKVGDGSSLTVSNATGGDAGDYHFVATNTVDSATSDAASLTVVEHSGLTGLTNAMLGSGNVFVSRVRSGGEWEQATDAAGIDADGNGDDSLIYDYQTVTGEVGQDPAGRRLGHAVDQQRRHHL